ncbi:unnamed protein product [Coregonus sp. 'balchen']|nr:unnamed protein product [Coregonus sp. 'balchen']
MTREKTHSKRKSTFLPPKRNPSLETYCCLVEKDVHHLLAKKQEYKVFHNIIIIKPADKGGAIVIQNAADYVKTILRQLSEDEFYKGLPKDPTNQFKSLIHDKLSKFLNEGEITKTEYEYMKVDCPTKPVIYALPKIHKSMKPPRPGKPIVSSNGSHFVKPWAISLPTYTRDSIDFMNLLKSVDHIHENSILCMFDVASLYTNIPHQGGLEALKFSLSERPPNALPSTSCIVDLAELKKTTNLTQRFKERGYKDNWVKHANDRFEGLTQLESLQPKVKEKAEHVPSCFTQYSPLGKAFKDIIRKHWYIIDTDPQLKPI